MNLLPDFLSLSFLQTAENMNKSAIYSSLPIECRSVIRLTAIVLNLKFMLIRVFHSFNCHMKNAAVSFFILPVIMISCKKPVMLKEIDRAYQTPGNAYQMAVAIGEYVHQYPDDKVLAEKFIKYLYEKGYFRESLHLAQSVLQRNPEDGTAWFYSAQAYSALYRFPEAEKCFTRLMKQNSSDNAIYNAYRKFQVRKRIFGSVASLDSLISLTNSDSLYRKRADLLLTANEVNAALSDYRYYLGRVSFDADALLNKFRAEMISRQYDSAGVTALRLSQAKKEKQVFARFAELVPQAREADEKIDKNPGHPDGYVEKARILLLLRFEQEAIDNLLTAVSLKPADPALRFKLALAYQVSGQEDKARELLKELQAQGIKLPEELRKKMKME